MNFALKLVGITYLSKDSYDKLCNSTEKGKISHIMASCSKTNENYFYSLKKLSMEKLSALNKTFIKVSVMNKTSFRQYKLCFHFADYISI